MGFILFRPGNKNPKKFPTKNGNKRRFGLLETIAKFMRPSGGFHLAKQLEVKEDMTMKKIDDTASGLLTLEEWILASPCLNTGISAKKVYPSMLEENNNKGSLVCDVYPQDSLSMEKAKNKVCEDDHTQNDDSLSLSRSQIEKTKKKVSFRFPVVADIFIMDSVQGYKKNNRNIFNM